MGKFGVHDYMSGFLLIESMVTVVEAILLQWVGSTQLWRAWLASATANTVSALFGWLVL